jgi:hypothetical protein
VSRAEFSLVNIVASSTSPFTGQQQLYAFPGQYWQGRASFEPATLAEGAQVQAFLAKLRGGFGTFLYKDPMAISHQGAGGVILANGAGQTGNTLNVDSMTPNTAIALAGDYFQLGSGDAARLYMFTEDLAADALGEGIATFEPNLRLSPAEAETLNVTNPLGAFRLAENTVSWSADNPVVRNMSITFREAI